MFEVTGLQQAPEGAQVQRKGEAGREPHAVLWTRRRKFSLGFAADNTTQTTSALAPACPKITRQPCNLPGDLRGNHHVHQRQHRPCRAGR